MKRVLVTATTLGLILAATSPADAAWEASALGGGYARARSMPAGNQPTAVVSGRNVTVSWAESSFPDGIPVSGYGVARYTAEGDPQATGVGCAGSITELTCTEEAVPAGSWRYTVTARQGDWTGGESEMSPAVTVQAPTLTLSPSEPVVLSLPATLSGSIDDYVDGETIRFRLDTATGEVLAGTVDGVSTPAAVPSGGSASIEVTVPAGTAQGAHSIVAVASPSGESASAPFTVDASPLLTTLRMFDTNANGRVDRVIATFSEPITCTSPCTDPWTLANAPSGGTLNAVSVAGDEATLTLTEGAGAPDTAVGSFTVTLAASATGIRDNNGNQGSFPPTAPADGAGPVPTAMSDTNGLLDGKMESGNSLSVTFSEAIAGASVPTTTTVTEADPAGSGSDTLAITGVTEGALSTGSDGYILSDGTSAWFDSSTVTLGNGDKTVSVAVGPACAPALGLNPCGVNITQGGPGTLQFRPAATITDGAGNAAVGTFSLSLRLF